MPSTNTTWVSPVTNINKHTSIQNKQSFQFLAENVAKQNEITRQEQDSYAAQSQQRAGEAIKSGKFQSEIVPVTVKERKGDVIVDQDEFPRPETTVNGLSKLRPAFVSVNLFISIKKR